MQVGDSFAAVFTVVDNKAKAVALAKLVTEAGGYLKEVAEYGLICRGGLAYAGDWLFGHDENVDGRLGGDVVEGEGEFILMGDFCGNLASDDFLK